MTWVVGASTLFGYGVVVSDIQVLCQRSGRGMDVLQKAYPVGKYIVAGFAGDAHAGLTLLEDLTVFLNSPPVPDDECWQPQWVADHWPESARVAYGRLGSQTPIGETHILMLGLQPKQRVLGNAVGHISVFRSPDFHPETQTGGRKFASIGCGSGVALYTDALRTLMLDEHLTFMKAEIGWIGGYGRVIADVLLRVASQHPTAGISEHFQLFLVHMGKIEQWDTPGMPKLAHGWPDLLRMLEEGIDPEALLATGLCRGRQAVTSFA